jgi:catechol 2,3-dioxygenase
VHDSRAAAEPAGGIQPPAYRLPDGTHVGLVALLVADLPRSVRYYEQVLGLRPLTVEPERAVLGAADERPLVELHARPDVTRARRGAFGLYHFALLLPDRAGLGRFAAHLASLRLRAGMADHLVSESLYLWDPDGLGIEVYADRPRSAWTHNGRELAMATDPLDLDAVIRAAAGVRWNGAPAGTAVGHVHLHVGDLAEAEAFYHRALGFTKTVWSYPGALFMAAGDYHHHLGTNVWSSGPAPSPSEARLLQWQLVVPSRDDVAAVGRSLDADGYLSSQTSQGLRAADPWGTRVVVVARA